MRWLATLCIAALMLLGVTADAKPTGKSSSVSKKSRRSINDKGTTKQCSTKDGKRRCRRVATFQGHNAVKSTLRTEPLAKPSGDIWLRADNLAEEVKLNIYKADGTYDEASLAKLDELFRCRATGEVRAVRADLYEQLSRIYDHFEGKRIHLVSGFRFNERNSSRHHHASAMDIRIQGVSIREMYKFAESLDTGELGIGIYPTSGFIHVDYRAPGEPSYRWTDWSGPGSGKGKRKKKAPGRTTPARKPVS